MPAWYAVPRDPRAPRAPSTVNSAMQAMDRSEDPFLTTSWLKVNLAFFTEKSQQIYNQQVPLKYTVYNCLS